MVIFAAIGILLSSIAIHEYSHVQDFRPINFTSGDVCLLNVGNLSADSAVGYFSYHHDAVYESQTQKIKEHTERKAFILEFVYVMLCAVIIFIFITQQYSKDLNTRGVTDSNDEQV